VPSLRVSSVTTDHAIGSLGSVVFYVWREVTRIEAIALVDAEVDIARLEPGPLAIFGVVEADAELPPADVRARLSEALRHFGELGGIASTLTFEGRGFRASAVRSVAAGLAVVARQPFPHRVFATISEAAGWLASAMAAEQPTTITAQNIVTAIAALR